MSKNKKKNQGKQLSHLEQAIKQSEKYYEELSEQHKEALKKLGEANEGEEIERTLKNEVYSFLLSEGLLEKFLEYRTNFHRTKSQETYYRLTMSANIEGAWIDQ